MAERRKGRPGKAEHIAIPRSAAGGGFDFTSHMRALCEDVCRRLPPLAHVDMDRVAVCFSQARKRVRHGLFASLTPMRFEDGAETEVRRGRRYAVQRLFTPDGREMLYILKFYLPRFMDESFEEKLVTVFHELWHVHPAFNGDIRRHAGRCHVHTHSQKEYDRRMGDLVGRWLALRPPEGLYQFLRLSYDELLRRHGGVRGIRIPQPKLILASQAAGKLG